MNMPRLLLRTLVAVLTLVAGVWLARAYVSLRPGPFSLCEVTGNTALYSGQVVRVKGALSGHLNDRGCGDAYGVFADVMLQEQPEYAGLIEDLQRLNTGDSYATSEVILTGRFEDVGTSCDAGRYRISEARLEKAGPINVELVNQPNTR
jgi:hypothetical protein